MPQLCGPVLKSVPATQRLNAYVHPWHLSLAESAKTGRYPSMHQLRTHFPSIVWKDYQASREALEIKFDLAGGDDIDFFKVKYIDGHCKGLLVQTILALIVHTVPWLPLRLLKSM